MRYWFSETSFWALTVSVFCFVFGLVMEFLVPESGGQVLLYSYSVAVIGGLIAACCILGRRVAVLRFKSTFGFLPSPEKYEERFPHLVAKEIRSRANNLQTAYRVLDQAREAMRDARNSVDADPLLRLYRAARRTADLHNRVFCGVVDAATSKWLPAPYKISRSYSDWTKP